MNVRAILRLFRIPQMWWAQIQGVHDLRSFLRLHFLYSAIESGLLEALRTPASKQELIQELRVLRPELLDRLLALGVSLQELSLEGGRYKVQGRRAQALISNDGGPFAAWIQEHVTYVSPVYRDLAARLRGDPLGNYLNGSGNMVARSSRLREPFVKNFLRTSVDTKEPMTVLDVGCGSGTYLQHIAQINPEISGFGIDIQDDVVKEAKMNLLIWGIDERFKVILADI